MAGPRWENGQHSWAGLHHAGCFACLISMITQHSHGEGTTINPLDQCGHWRSQRLSHLPQFTQMTGQARIRIRLLAPKLGLLPLKKPTARTKSIFFKTKSDSLKPQLGSGGGNDPRSLF